MDASSDTDSEAEQSEDSANGDIPVSKEEIENMDWDALARRAAARIEKEGADESDEEIEIKKLRADGATKSIFSGNDRLCLDPPVISLLIRSGRGCHQSKRRGFRKKLSPNLLINPEDISLKNVML